MMKKKAVKKPLNNAPSMKPGLVYIELPQRAEELTMSLADYKANMAKKAKRK